MKRAKTTTFLLELPLCVDAGQARRLHAHFEVARCFYNNMLGEANRRLKRMCSDPLWWKTRQIPRSQRQERAQAYARLHTDYGFSEFALHDYATEQRVFWIADHLDANTAQTLASRAFHAVNRVCLGKAKHVRFRSKGRGLDSIEGKTNKQGIRFVLQTLGEGHHGWLVWGKERLPALIAWNDPVVKHGLDQRIKFARLIRRKASSPQAKGADFAGYRYGVQLALEGLPFQKPKHFAGPATIGLDIGPSSLAIFAQQGQAQLVTFCEEIKPKAQERRRLQRKMDRQRRANNPDNYDEQGRYKRGRLQWKESRGYRANRRRYANNERRIAAHRKSLQGNLANDIVRMGNTIQIEKTSFRAWQKQYGRSVTLRAPGMFVELVKRAVAKTGGILTEVSTLKTKLSQYCHQCGKYKKKQLSQRWHRCPCGIGPVQRDLYSAFLLAYLKPTDITPSIDRYVWEGSELSLRAAVERLQQRANDGQVLPRSFGITGGRARQLESLQSCQQELVPPFIYLYRRGRLEALCNEKEPLAF
ncbi:MAG: zinc ribbon domain-containing protein [Ktedonobacteraceae bacterium]